MKILLVLLLFPYIMHNKTTGKLKRKPLNDQLFNQFVIKISMLLYSKKLIL